MRVRTICRIEGGILDGTEIEPLLAFVAVRYPHRKTADLYVPPIKTAEKEIKTWHCCQDNCPQPDFEGGLEALVNHLMLHKGRLLRPWSKKKQLKSPMPAIKLPRNPWAGNHGGVGDDRRVCLDLYITDVRAALRKQGIEVIEEAKDV